MSTLKQRPSVSKKPDHKMSQLETNNKNDTSDKLHSSHSSLNIGYKTNNPTTSNALDQLLYRMIAKSPCKSVQKQPVRSSKSCAGKYRDSQASKNLCNKTMVEGIQSPPKDANTPMSSKSSFKFIPIESKNLQLLASVNQLYNPSKYKKPQKLNYSTKKTSTDTKHCQKASETIDVSHTIKKPNSSQYSIQYTSTLSPHSGNSLFSGLSVSSPACRASLKKPYPAKSPISIIPSSNLLYRRR